MTRIVRQALVARPPERMYALVDGVERYPELFSWCQSVDVIERAPGTVSARLHVRASGVEFSFATRNTLDPPRHIHLSMIEGPLRSLEGDWRFQPYGDGGCRIDLELEFQPRNRLLGIATSLAFQRLADRMVEDFCARAMDSDA